MRAALLARGRARQTLRTDRWFALLATTRLLGTGLALLLLVANDVSARDVLFVAILLVWSFGTLLAFGRSATLRGSPVAWLVDCGAALGLVLASGDWRSPFYVFALTTLVLPGTGQSPRRALLWGGGFSVAYTVVAVLTRRLSDETFTDPPRLETLATHLFVPLIVILALAHGSHLLERLQQAREESERLAVQAERQRIAWELHDSAKQRVHAAHLLLSALDGVALGASREVLDHALAELRGATADMESSVAELRTPLDGRPVDAMLRERAIELERAGNVRIDVTGTLPPLPPLVAAHTYRIAAEALTNAVRHAECSGILIDLDPAGRLTISDDGVGIPDPRRVAGHGLRSMRGRAETIGARLAIGPGTDGRGTLVELSLPPRSLTI